MNGSATTTIAQALEKILSIDATVSAKRNDALRKLDSLVSPWNLEKQIVNKQVCINKKTFVITDRLKQAGVKNITD